MAIKEKKPVESIEREVKKNGCFGRTIRKYSYVALLCEINGSAVMAVRYDYFERKEDVSKKVKEDYPGWKSKGVYKLYNEDFDPPAKAVETFEQWKEKKQVEEDKKADGEIPGKEKGDPEDQ